MNSDPAPRDLPVETHAAIGAAWEAIPDDMTDDYPTLADAIRVLVKQREQAFVQVSSLADSIAGIRAECEAACPECAAAWAHIPDSLVSEGRSLSDAVDTLVRLGNDCIENNHRLNRRIDEHVAARIPSAVAEDRENDAATSALWALRQYMARLNDAGTLTVPRVLGWLDHAIDGADQ